MTNAQRQRFVVPGDTPIFEEVAAWWLSEGKHVPGRTPGRTADERAAAPEAQRKEGS
jgi:hypothetical protein